MPTQHRERKHNRPLCPACQHTTTRMGTTSSGTQRWRCAHCGHTCTNPNVAKTSAYRFATHTPARHTCANATKPTHPTAGRRSTTPASTPTSTPPGPYDTAGQDEHKPSTTRPNPPIPPPKKHTFCHLSRHAEKAHILSLNPHFVA
ncbi:transposase-like zinc-binding domain-containing protein [Corynebacterium hadale]|uniref:IS1/IS1595 family N-terminal zinc-binding domain-containing protein n=1 Tax=Corynebacterium hadale TaxID=2026255 RepID=UPI003B8A6786